MVLKHRLLRIIISLLIVFAVVAFWVLRPIRDTDFSLVGFIPLRKDALAARFAPLILPHEMYGTATRLYYRMAKDDEGKIYIAYHPYFEDEMNPHKGFGATMSRIIYTGGLRLKDFIFGKADLELIEVVLDKNLTPLELSWEGVENYQPKNFGVKHKNQTEKNAKPPYCFSVITWNHMVARTDASACMAAPRLTPQYFAEEAWQEFRMVKKTEAILRRNRAHRAYERKAASTR